MDLEFAEQGSAGARAFARIRHIAPSRHHDASDTGAILPRRTYTHADLRAPSNTFPTMRKKHRRRVRGCADVSEVGCDIASGNVQATAEHDRQMRKVTASADLLMLASAAERVAFAC